MHTDPGGSIRYLPTMQIAEAPAIRGAGWLQYEKQSWEYIIDPAMPDRLGQLPQQNKTTILVSPAADDTSSTVQQERNTFACAL